MLISILLRKIYIKNNIILQLTFLKKYKVNKYLQDYLIKKYYIYIEYKKMYEIYVYKS